MVYQLYAIRDVKVGFLTPTVERSESTAVRNFSHAVVNSNNILSSYAKDFALYRIGTYDDETGRITPEDLPVHVYEASDAILHFGADGGESDAW